MSTSGKMPVVVQFDFAAAASSRSSKRAFALAFPPFDAPSLDKSHGSRVLLALGRFRVQRRAVPLLGDEIFQDGSGQGVRITQAFRLACSGRNGTIYHMSWYVAFLNGLEKGMAYSTAVDRADRVWVKTSTPEEKRAFVRKLLRDIARENSQKRQSHE